MGDQSTTAELPGADVLSGGRGWFDFRGPKPRFPLVSRGHLRDTQVAAEGLREGRIARLLPKNSSQVLDGLCEDTAWPGLGRGVGCRRYGKLDPGRRARPDQVMAS